MRHENLTKQTNYDPIAGRIGSDGPESGPGWDRNLFVPFLPQRLYTTSVVCHSGLKTILQHRLSRRDPVSARLFRLTPGSQTQTGASLLDLVLCRKKAAKKGAFETLLNATLNHARQMKLIPKRPIGAVDSTGMESRHASRYYVHRVGYKRFLRYSWPKITAVCEVDTHLFAGCIVTRGPSNDSPQFIPVMKQAAEGIHFTAALADAAYDGEHNHRFCREDQQIEQTMIPLNRRRGRKWPKEPYRRQMKTQFDKELYKQRSQIESVFSRHKRLMGSALRGRTETSQKRECLYRVLTHNLMILRCA